MRNDPVQGHMMLNKAADHLVKILFIANKEYIPHEKWLIHMSRTLNWRPDNWERRLIDIFLTSNVSLESLKIRQNNIKEIWEELDNYLNKSHFNNPIPVMYNGFYRLLKRLFEIKRIKIDDWKKESNMGILNNDPFHKIIIIEGDKIILDIEKAKEMKPEEMYQWHYEVLKIVRKGI